jgi:hypothetical protein
MKFALTAAAHLAAFAVSGLLHELAISLPVGAGYGGPTAYFGPSVRGVVEPLLT